MLKHSSHSISQKQVWWFWGHISGWYCMLPQSKESSNLSSGKTYQLNDMVSKQSYWNLWWEKMVHDKTQSYNSSVNCFIRNLEPDWWRVFLLVKSMPNQRFQTVIKARGPTVITVLLLYLVHDSTTVSSTWSGKNKIKDWKKIDK